VPSRRDISRIQALLLSDGHYLPVAEEALPWATQVRRRAQRLRDLASIYRSLARNYLTIKLSTYYGDVGRRIDCGAGVDFSVTVY